MPAPSLILTLLLATGFTVATWLQPRAVTWNSSRANSGNLLNIIMGDARRMFADHFFTKADVYFHSGYYPSIFDEGRTNEVHIAEQAAIEDKHDGKPEDELRFLGPPRDWIEAFGRNFFNTRHTELTGAGVNEILPWLRISIELDPQRVETYTVTAYWLRGEMKRPRDAEAFLREGLRANPESYEILFELGRLYETDYHDPDRARNLWQLADRKLAAHEQATGEVETAPRRQILINLARMEETAGHLPEAIHYLQRLHDALQPGQEAQKLQIEKQIAELQQKSASQKIQ